MTRTPFRLFALVALCAGLAGLAAPGRRRPTSWSTSNQGVLQPMPIAIPSFGGAGPTPAISPR